MAGRDVADLLGATRRRCGPSRATLCPNSCISRTAARGTAGSCCSTATRTRSPGASTTSSSPGRHLRPRGLPRTPRRPPDRFAKTDRASSRRSSCTISPSRRPPRNRATRTASKPAAAPATTTTTTNPYTPTAKTSRRSRSSTTPRGRGSSGRSSTTWSGSSVPARAPRRAACEASGARDARALAPTTPRGTPLGSTTDVNAG